MAGRTRGSTLSTLVDRFPSIGAYPEEPEAQRARRRIMVAAIWLATLLALPTIANDLAQGYFWGGMLNLAVVVVTAGVLVALHVRPGWSAVLINVLLATVFVVQLIQMAMYCGLLDSRRAT